MRAFDQPLFKRKLQELVRQNVRNFEVGRLKVRDANIALSFSINEAYLMKLVDTDIAVLRDSFVPAVEKACCDVQISGGNAITSVFISEELVPRVRATVKDRRADIRQNLEMLSRLVVRPNNWCLPSVLAHFSREMSDFEKDMRDRHDSKIDQLKRQELQTRLHVAKKAVGLSGRETDIWKVIGRGSRGAAYCRELHNAGLRPRKSWTDDDCPRTYPGAYLDRRWRKRIQDEKYKVSQKALAQLAGE
jgi:hypothetical protein